MELRPFLETQNSNEAKLYFNAIRTKFDTTIGLDQNGNLICFLGVQSELPPFLAQVHILCELASDFEGLDPACQVDLSLVNLNWDESTTNLHEGQDFDIIALVMLVPSKRRTILVNVDII